MGTFDYLITGATLGFIAGISPGPILTLVISETMKYNRKEGIKIAFTPLMTDLPIMLFSIFVAFEFSNFDTLLGIISFLGAIFIAYLGLMNIRIKSADIKIEEVKGKSIQKGIITNFLSPHPYLFWILVGAPITINAYHYKPVSAILFIAGFYILIIGTKIIIAILSEKSKKVISGNAYIIIVKILGFVLVLFSVILIYDGLKHVGLLH